MAKLREPLLGIAVGRKGVGKTYSTLKLIDNYLKSDPQTGKKGRKVLILDVNNEFKCKRLALKDVPRFSSDKYKKIEARRVTIFKENGGKMTLNEIADSLFYILENYYGGLLLVEDINRYVSDSLPNDLIGAICTQRHQDCDLILHFQTIGKAAHPKIWGNANWLRFHKTDDTVERHKNKFAGNIEHLYIMEQMVHSNYYNGGIHFHCYLDKDSGKIRGNFSKQLFQEAVENYLSDNYNKVVKPILNKVDLKTGNRLYKNQTEVVNSLIRRMVDQYYGNPM